MLYNYIVVISIMPDELSSALRALEGNDSPRFDQVTQFLQLVSDVYTLNFLLDIPDHILQKRPSDGYIHLFTQAREARPRLPEQRYKYGCLVLNKFASRLGVDERKLQSKSPPFPLRLDHFTILNTYFSPSYKTFLIILQSGPLKKKLL